MDSTPVGGVRRSLSFPQLLLLGAEILLFIALLLPWWSVTVFFASASLDGFHSWGWLSFVAWLVTLGLGARLVFAANFDPLPIGQMIPLRLAAQLVVVMGAVEILGDLLFIGVAPNASGSGVSAGIDAGVIIAIICGLAIVYSGLAMLNVSWLPKPKGRAATG